MLHSSLAGVVAGCDQMSMSRAPRAPDCKLLPLAAALMLICAGAPDSATAAAPIGSCSVPSLGVARPVAPSAANFGAALPASWVPGDRSGVAALMRGLHDVGVKQRPATPEPAGMAAVTSCADDNDSGTLRNVIAAAGEGDTIDLGALTCSVITLTQGAIPVLLDNLTISGPGQDKLAIDGACADRVFVHYGSDTLRLRGLTVRNGVNILAGYMVAGGACVLSGGYVTLEGSTVGGCLANGEGAYGGGILAYGLTMYTSTLSGNTAQGSLLDTLTASYGGGAFAYRGTTALYDSTVSGNRAAPDPANTHASYDTGGGIFADNGGYALRSTIDSNYSSGTGGGIASHAAFFISNSTISGNVARTKAGGGIFVRLFDAMSVSNSTIANNSAPKGGGIYVSGSAQGFTLQSTIVADNAAASGSGDIAAQNALNIAGANNLVMTADAATTLPADTLHGGPELLPLTKNGGPTRTHALQPSSPAVDAGNNIAQQPTDQRGTGFPRVLGARADIGAFESAVPAPPPAAVPTLSIWCLMLLTGVLAWSARHGFGQQRRQSQLDRCASVDRDLRFFRRSRIFRN